MPIACSCSSKLKKIKLENFASISQLKILMLHNINSHKQGQIDRCLTNNEDYIPLEVQNDPIPEILPNISIKLETKLSESNAPIMLVDIRLYYNLFIQEGLQSITEAQVQKFTQRFPELEHVESHEITFHLLAFLTTKPSFTKIFQESHIFDSLNLETFPILEDTFRSDICQTFIHILSNDPSASTQYLNSVFDPVFQFLTDEETFNCKSLEDILTLTVLFVPAISDSYSEKYAISLFHIYEKNIHHISPIIQQASAAGLTYLTSMYTNFWFELEKQITINRLIELGRETSVEGLSSSILILLNSIFVSMNNARFDIESILTIQNYNDIKQLIHKNLESRYKSLLNVLKEKVENILDKPIEGNFDEIEVFIKYISKIASPINIDIGALINKELSKPEDDINILFGFISTAFGIPAFINSLEDNINEILEEVFSFFFLGINIKIKKSIAFIVANFLGYANIEIIKAHFSQQLFVDVFFNVFQFDEPEVLSSILNGLGRVAKISPELFYDKEFLEQITSRLEDIIDVKSGIEDEFSVCKLCEFLLKIFNQF